MSEKQKEILEKISETVPGLDAFDMGYILGTAEEMARSKKQKEE